MGIHEKVKSVENAVTSTKWLKYCTHTDEGLEAELLQSRITQLVDESTRIPE